MTKKKKRKALLMEQNELQDCFSESDETFYYIAGYTSGGAPYGVTWEEMGLEPYGEVDEEDLSFKCLEYTNQYQNVITNGQITVPIEIRRKLNIEEGDTVIFIEKANGDIVLQNPSKTAIREAQNALKDVNISEEEILKDLMDLRY
jgi:antitoxin PrlF